MTSLTQSRSFLTVLFVAKSIFRASVDDDDDDDETFI